MLVSVSDVKKLRQITGAGFMDCKKALEETGSDLDKAVEELRKRGQKLANKRSDRQAKEGVVIAKIDSRGEKGVIISLNCETDFVAKNEDFISEANRLASIALGTSADTISEFLEEKTDDGKTIADVIASNTAKIGEKLEIGHFHKITASRVGLYNHHSKKLSAMVGISVQNADLAKELAMHVAASDPMVIDESNFSDEVLRKELEIAIETLKKEGKPEEKLTMIANGKLNKFKKTNALLEQPFVRNEKQSVKAYIESVDQSASVLNMLRVSLA